MREIPECLKLRYKALDELIRDLSTYGASHPDLDASSDDPEIKLMCEFWNILKEDPSVNLKQAVQHCMGLNANNSRLFGQSVECFMAGSCDKHNEKKSEPPPKEKNQGGKINKEESNTVPQKIVCSKELSKSSVSKAQEPLHKVLCNLKEAASFEKKCTEKVDDLLESQKQLQDQIIALELRENDGKQLLKQAECMWSCMEDLYKKKIAESLERQQTLLKQLKEVEASNTKWRNNKKDLDFQLNNITKCHQEIVEQINQRTNDVKCIDIEIENFNSRIESDKKDLENAQKSLVNKKKASDGRIAVIASQVTKLEKILVDEKKYKDKKENEGRTYIKEGRSDLQKICKVLLQKKLENEDMKAEKEALLLEIEMLKQTCDQCREKCKKKQNSILDEIYSLDKEIADFKVRCIRCHECTDTEDVRHLCTDCPRCLRERECVVDGDSCNPDHTMDCVCSITKQKFLDNVFDNMYTLLERQIKTEPGKAVAATVMDCLKRSKNGKINKDTKKILQDFILTSVRKNLKLTIIGGAVKTRCEMDPDTYKQLMLCLKEVKVTKPPKADKGTDSKKDPCKRWGGPSECNCPYGPKNCVCIGKGLLPSSETQTCPPKPDADDDGGIISCPYHKNTPCGADCGSHGMTDVGKEVAAWRPDPCQGPSCQFRNMRAAQCVLGPEVLSSISGPGCISPYDTTSSVLGKQATCKCSGTPNKLCVCHKDLRSQPRQNIIQEVLGRYTDVTPIEKVVSVDGYSIRETNGTIKSRDASFDEIYLSRQNIETNTLQNKSFQFCNCSFNSMNSLSDNFLEEKCNHIGREQSSNESYRNLYMHNFSNNNTVKSSRQINESRDEELSGILKNSSSKELKYIAQEDICTEVNKLMKEVIVFDDTVKSNNVQEWISLSSFIKEVKALTQIISNESNVLMPDQLSKSLSNSKSTQQDLVRDIVSVKKSCEKIGSFYIIDKYNEKYGVH